MLRAHKKGFSIHLILWGFLFLFYFFLFDQGANYLLFQSLEKKAFFLERSLEQDKPYEEFFAVYDLHKKKIIGSYPNYWEEPLLAKELSKAAVYKKSTAFISYNQQKAAIFTKRGILRQEPHFLQIIYPLQVWEETVGKIKFFLGGGLLCFFVLYTIAGWKILASFFRPIQKILQGIRPYQEGKKEFLPQISLSSEDEWESLVETLNSLSGKVESQIQTLLRQHSENASILESLIEGVIACSEVGNIIYINHVACQMLGGSTEDFLGLSFLQIQPKERGLLQECEELRLFCQEEEKLCSKLICLKNKKYMNLVALPKEKKGGAILVLQDKTADFRILQMGKEFIANASHELRTPITIIRGFAETLYDHPQLPRKVRKEILTKMVNTCERFHQVIKNLLTLNEVENASSTHFALCDVEAILENCRHMLLSIHPKVGLHIKGNNSLKIWGSSDLIELALMNLLENAVKYSTDRVEIVLAAKQEKEQIFLEVQDQGIGIPAAEIDHIFERFYTVDKARSKKLGGVGLGLSIVKQIVEKHAGQIQVSSEESKGTLFRLVFPIYPLIPGK